MTQPIVGRTLVIVNPHGVSLHRSRVRDQIQAAVDDQQVVLLETQYGGHAGDYCRQHAADFDKLIVVGGDGLLMDVVNGALDADIAIGPLPGGSACDFVKAAPGYPLELGQLLAATESVPIDLGKVTFTDGSQLRFITEASFGIAAATVVFVPRWLRKLSPKRAYDVGALRALLRYRPYDVRLNVDGDVYGLERLHLLAVCSTAYFGDGMPVAPDAKMDDGQFHIYAVSGVSRREIVRNFASLRKGTHIHHPKSLYRSCRRVEFETEIPAEICFDGDLVPRVAVSCEIEPGRIRLIAPPSA